MVNQVSEQKLNEILDVLHEVSNILHTNLDRETLAVCVRLIESGVNPDALAAAVQELQFLAAQQQNSSPSTSADRS